MQISGEREPLPIYNDFLKAFDQILDSDVKMIRPRPQSSGSYRDYRTTGYEEDEDEEQEGGGGGGGSAAAAVLASNGGKGFRRGKPLVIWIMGMEIMVLKVFIARQIAKVGD